MRLRFAGLALVAVAFTTPSQIKYTANGTGAVSRTLASKLSESINIKDFGASCNGVTDASDSAAMTLALAYIGSGVGTINTPVGCVFNTSFNIPNSVTVRFDQAPAGTGVFAYNGDYYYPHHIRLQDNAPFANAMMEIDHVSTISSEYGIDIQNYSDNGAAPTPGLGAQIGFVIHQYSDAGPAMQIDNTRSGPFIRFKEASNSVNSFGTQGTGPFFDFWGYTTGSPNTNLSIGSLNQVLAFTSNDVSRPWTFTSSTTADALKIIQSNAGLGLNIQQSGASNAISIAHSGAAHGVNITTAVGADGFYPLIVNGRTNGGNFTISQNASGNNALVVSHAGVGAGDALFVVNKGTGKGIRLQNGVPADVWSLDSTGKVIYPTGGAADIAGRAVLVAGTKTVSTTAVTASSVVQLTNCVGGGTIGLPQVGTVTAATSFVINSVQPGTASTLQAADTSTICWQLIN